MYSTFDNSFERTSTTKLLGLVTCKLSITPSILIFACRGQVLGTLSNAAALFALSAQISGHGSDSLLIVF